MNGRKKIKPYSLKRVLYGMVLLCGIFPLLSISAEESPPGWPQFRGDGTGVSTETGLLRVWPEDGPPVSWRRFPGTGYSGIVVAGERFYTLYARGGTTYLAAFLSVDGSEIWRRALGEPFEDEFGVGPRATPALDGEMVFGLSGRGRLLAARAEDGAKVWETDLFVERPAIDTPVESRGLGDPVVLMPNFGYSASPLVVDDLVILVTGAGPGKFITAMDRESGELRWEALGGTFHYATPVLATLAGSRQLIVQTAASLHGVALDGKVLWQHPWHTLAQPVALPPDRVFASAAMGASPGALVLGLDAMEGSPVPEVIWEGREMRNFWTGSVAYEGHVYGFDNATFKCLNAETGERCWAKRGLGKGSQLIAEDRLIVFSDQGTLVLVDTDPAAYRELGRVRIFEQAARTWTPPSLAGGHLYVRRATGELVRLDLRASSGVETAARSEETSATTPGVVASSVHDGGEILDRVIRALGGQERWDVLDALQIKCRFTTFSKPRPCSISRRRPNLYRFEYFFASHKIVLGYDGKSTWWINESPFDTTSGAEPAPDAVARELLIDADFAGTLLEAKARGHRVVGSAAGEIAGRAGWKLEILRADGNEETWYLDRQTWLPFARVSPGSFQRFPRRKISFFEEYRDFDGLQIPVRIEIELDERFQVLEIESVDFEGTPDPVLFRAPRAGS